MTEPELTLVEFLRERLDERERVVQGSGRLGWLTFRRPDGSMDYTTAASQAGDDSTWVVGGMSLVGGYAKAVVVHDEARVLAEVAAARAILALHDPPGSTTKARRWCAGCLKPDDPDLFADMPCQHVRLLAQPYANHPDWRDEWRVAG